MSEVKHRETDQHIPGPWNTMERHGHLYVRSTATTLCEIVQGSGRAEANARLIAAAPSLLTALKWLEDSVLASQESPEAANWHYKDVRHGLDLARAAIATYIRLTTSQQKGPQMTTETRFTFTLTNNGREIENVAAGDYATEAEAEAAGTAALDDYCPAGSANRRYYRVEVAGCKTTATTLYRMVRSAEDWAKIMDRDLDGWYTDIDCTEPATREQAEQAGDDIYTDCGWNVEPKQYPVLAHTA